MDPETHDNQTPRMNPMERRNRRLVARILRVFFVVAIVIVAYRMGEDAGRDRAIIPTDRDPAVAGTVTQGMPGESGVDFGLFWDVWDILEAKYVDRSALDPQQLFYGAIDGMLAATGDPYTTFFDPQEQKEFDEDITGEFHGIGAEMGIRDDILTVIAPLSGSPAEQSGLMAGDKVLKIDDTVTTQLSLDESVSRIRGPEGTEVRLTIYRKGEDESREVVIRRAIIDVKSVETTYRDDGIAIIEVSMFGDDTERLFTDALKEARNRKARAIVLDLRNNPGGYLDGAVTLASQLLPPGKTVVIEENGAGERKEMRSGFGQVSLDVPITVLINEGTASASEILAGSLRAHRDDVTIVGRTSFGKGSVQELVPVAKDMSVKITIARWLTPEGEQINEKGIAPDVDVQITVEDIENERDPQLDKAIEILQ